MKTHDDVNRIVELFKQRSAYWTSQAYFGAALYRKLAEDSHLPENFSPKVAAAILGVKPEAMAQRRKRGAPPSFFRWSQNSVDYPRGAFCLFLADRFVERRTALAAPEYTRIPA